ncbi:MAG: DUF6383 domain-containing protein [Prevotellaceae bacterium]|jgi:hypothetical protein|nr:DUF6383 domain-containing protein [Prevotellaceae bacterium]
MKTKLTLVALFICGLMAAENPVLTNTSSTYSSGYLVGIDGYSNSEIRKVDVPIRDIVDLMKNFNDGNPKLKNTYSTNSSGYLLGIDNYSNPEIKKVNISIADLSDLVTEFNRGGNPKLKNTYNTNSSGYLVGIDGYSNPEIKKVDISIADLSELIKEAACMKSKLNRLEEENALLKEQLIALSKHVGFELPETSVVPEMSSNGSTIYAERGSIVIQNALNEDILVFNLAGQLTAQQIANSDLFRISVAQPGVYIVCVGADVSKVMVY